MMRSPIWDILLRDRLIGRTTEFGSVYRGSNPFPSVIYEMKHLVNRIRTFLKTYASKSTDDEEIWSSPDAFELEQCANALDSGRKISKMPWSSWESGGYTPYTSNDGRREHAEILAEIKNLL